MYSKWKIKNVYIFTSLIIITYFIQTMEDIKYSSIVMILIIGMNLIPMIVYSFSVDNIKNYLLKRFLILTPVFGILGVVSSNFVSISNKGVSQLMFSFLYLSIFTFLIYVFEYNETKTKINKKEN